MPPPAVGALRASDRVIVPTDLTLPCVRAAWRTLAALATTGIAADAISLVASRYRSTAFGLTPDDLRELLGMPLACTLPDDDAAGRALAAGTPLYAVDPASPLRSAIVAFAEALTMAPRPGRPDREPGREADLDVAR